MPGRDSGKEALWAEILRDCAWETIAHEKIRRLSALLGPEDVPWLMGKIAALDLTELEDDAGDISDEFWRITMSVSEALVPLGSAAKPYLDAYRGSNHSHVRMALKFLHDKGISPSDEG